MKKLIVVLVVLGMLTGCGKVNRVFSNYMGTGAEVCQGGVVYLQFSSGVSVAYTPDGKIKTCKE